MKVGEQPPLTASVATRVEAAQEGPDEVMRQALTARSAREPSATSSADIVDKGQIGEEKPVSSLGSPVCQTFCDLIMLIRDANGVNKVKYENLVERCVKHPEEKGCTRFRRVQEGCSRMGICGTHGLVDPTSSRRGWRETTCTKRKVSCTDLSKMCS